MGKKNRKKILLTKVALVSVILCCISVTIVLNSPLGLCFDIFSGKTPSVAIERFIQMLITATLEEDYTWITMVSTENAVNQMKYLQERTIIISEDYILEKSDDLAGVYEYNVTFGKGTIHLAIEAIWPTCPDFDVTDDEIIENIRLLNVKSPIIPIVLPLDEE